jgi:hypothetical protein
VGWTVIIVVQFWAGIGDFIFSKTITLALHPKQPFIFGGAEAFPLRLKQLVSETGCSSWSQS